MAPLEVPLSLTSHLSADVRQDNEFPVNFTGKDLLSLPHAQILSTRLLHIGLFRRRIFCLLKCVSST